MKNLHFLGVFLLLFSSGSAQDFNEKLQNMRMGLYVSPAINFIQTDSENAETNANPGLIYGYAMEISLNENHKLESGLSIAYKGGDITLKDTAGNINSDYEIRYITLPIFIKMRSRQIGYFNYFARIGPSINFRIREMITSTSNEDKNTNLALVDISIFLGAEYSLGGKTSIDGSLFFNNNITNALGDTNDPQALFHQVGIRLGFLF